jgi:lysophospholipase L1-like esterase
MLLGGAAQAPRILALGDSYTIGESVDEVERWPVQLTEMLKAHGIRLAPPHIIARTGWTTDELQAAITAAAPRGPYPLVTLLIGVNNQYRGRALEEYREQFAELLDVAIGLAGQQATHVLVLSIPDWGITPFAAADGRDLGTISTQIDNFNAAAQLLTQARGAHWIDITPLTREAAQRPELLATDGLHPSAVDYQRWAQAALPVAQEVLQSLRQTRQAR